jgi:ABC-type uncharacterized transport system substrate-binding protein
MKRRDFITLLGGGAAAWPLAARAQQARMPVMGLINSRAPGDSPELMAAFRKGLKETGFVEGRNVTIESRFAGNQYERLPALAADLAHRQPSVIAAPTTPAALAAKTATSTIPIVFATAGDPVRLGLVASLSRPGGNVTGITILSVEVAPKRLELLHELLPTASIVALLVNPTNPVLAEPQSDSVRSAASGLMSYGGDIPDAYRLTGVYAARILKGERPDELPVQQSTKVEMFLNLKTAKALGITVQLPLSGRADEVIE